MRPLSSCGVLTSKVNVNARASSVHELTANRNAKLCTITRDSFLSRTMKCDRRLVMSISNGPVVLGLLVALVVNACSGGGGGYASAGLPQGSAPGAAVPTATRTYLLTTAAGSYDLPSLSGFRGSLALPAAMVPPDTRLELTSSLTAPADAPVLDAARRTQATGTFNVYFYTTIRLSNTVTFPTLPGFSVTLPATIAPAGLQFFYAISNPMPASGTQAQYRTEGPATVAEGIASFAPSATPLTLKAGQSYTLAFYAVSAIAAKPTPTPRGKIYVANSGNNTVTTYTTDGTPTTPTITSGLNSPVSVAVDAAGKIYVVNSGNNTVTTYNPNGSRTTPTITGLSGPEAVAVDAAGKIYVSSGGLVATYTANGTPTTPTITAGLDFSEGLAVDASGKIYVANYYAGVTIYEADGTQTTSPFSVFGAQAVALDPTGKIVCIGGILIFGLHAGVHFGSASCYAADGTPTIPQFGGVGYPIVTGVAVDVAGNLYVATPSSNTVTTYTVSGKPTSPTITGLSSPAGLAVR
jgi:YVTN family beta-propeller protein